MCHIIRQRWIAHVRAHHEEGALVVLDRVQMLAQRMVAGACVRHISHHLAAPDCRSQVSHTVRCQKGVFCTAQVRGLSDV